MGQLSAADSAMPIRRRPNSTQAIRRGTFRRSYGSILVKLTEKEKQRMKYIKIPKCFPYHWENTQYTLTK